MPASELADMMAKLRVEAGQRATSPPADLSSAMTDSPIGKIDRAALERIMQRAAELQTGERDIGEGLTPEEVLALGKEVGIPPVTSSRRCSRSVPASIRPGATVFSIAR